jgi:hypothetical protein
MTIAGRRRLTDGVATQRAGDLVENAAIPRRGEGSHAVALVSMKRCTRCGVFRTAVCFRLQVPST